MSYLLFFRWMLQNFIEFSILYKKKVGNKLDNSLNLKLKIWNFYKISIARNILSKFIFNST